jgi:hypothetical protein
MFHWLFNSEPKVIKYRCLLCDVCCNEHTQVKNQNNLNFSNVKKQDCLISRGIILFGLLEA